MFIILIDTSHIHTLCSPVFQQTNLAFDSQSICSNNNLCLHITSECEPVNWLDLGWNKEEFEDIFFDTSDFKLAKSKQWWLRNRSIAGTDQETWSLKQMDYSTSNFLTYSEITKEEVILAELRKIGVAEEDEEDLESLCLRPFAFYDVTRFSNPNCPSAYRNQYAELVRYPKNTKSVYCLLTKIKTVSKDEKLNFVADSPPPSKLMELLRRMDSPLNNWVYRTQNK